MRVGRAFYKTRPVARFPLSAHASGRYIVDADGQPWPLLMRNAWPIIGYTAAERTLMFSHAAALGFTGIEIWLPGHYPGTRNVPGDANNNLPFAKTLGGSDWGGAISGYANNNAMPDLSTANQATAYWNAADAMLDEMKAFNLFAICFFAYGGYPEQVGGVEQGWLKEMIANGPVKVRAYADFIVSRFGHKTNLAYAIGGDFGPRQDVGFGAAEEEVEDAFVAGITGPGRACTLVATEWSRPSLGTDLYPASVTLNNSYGAALDLNSLAEEAYAIDPPKPTFALEYTAETGVESIPFRRQAIWSFLSGICGYCMMSTAWEPGPTLANLNTVGTVQAGYFNSFVRQFPNWYELKPGRDAITAGGGTNNVSENYVVCARNKDGSNKSTLLWAYCPPSHTGSITFDRTVMAGSFRQRYWDPTNNTYEVIATGVSNTSTQALTPPANAAGANDRMIIFDIP